MRCDRNLVAVLWSAFCLAACAAPTLHVDAEPAKSELFIDGRFEGLGEHEMRLPYYGTASIYLMPPFDPGTPPRTDTRATVTVDEPISPWFFPLDFLLEMGGIGIGWIEDERHEIRVANDPRTDIVLPGRVPPGLEELRRNAASMAVAR